MRRRRKATLFVLILVASLFSVLISTKLFSPQAIASVALLQPVPTQKSDYYDYFGKTLTQQEADQLVRQQGLDPKAPGSYERIGAVHVTQQLLDAGENLFFKRGLGNRFNVFGRLSANLQSEFTQAIQDLGGQPTTNLQITLQKDLKVGSHILSKGTVINTGVDVERGGKNLFGFANTGGLTCATCHATLSSSGDRLTGVPNSDLDITFLLALAPNSASGFARLKFDPLDPKYQGNGKTIIDSKNNSVKLPDPQKFEDAFDDALLDLPAGNFESSPDSISNTTQIPSTFTFNTGPYMSDGQLAVGPFGGLSAFNNAVHSSELNLLAAAQLSDEILGIDPEVYLGTVLQNAADPTLRLPEGETVKPSEWLRRIKPDPYQAELEDQVPSPTSGVYPNLNPSLVTYNGLFFSPNTNKPDDIASGPFWYAANAMAAFQNSLLPPPNRSPENQQALKSGSVQRGAKVFEQANCATCHIPPFFTDNIVHPISEIGTNPARAESRLALNNLLVPPKLYTFNTPVPIPADAETIDVPTEGISDTPTSLPKGMLPDGGYKTTSLLGVAYSAPYLHDSGVAVGKDSLKVADNGSFTVVDPSGLGLTGTLSQGKSADSANSLRALVDRNLRDQVVSANQANPGLVNSNLDGTGHDFYVDQTTGFTPAQQNDLINFLLALDDNPGSF